MIPSAVEKWHKALEQYDFEFYCCVTYAGARVPLIDDLQFLHPMTDTRIAFDVIPVRKLRDLSNDTENCGNHAH